MPDYVPSKSLDILGVKPIGNAVEKVTEGAVEGARSFFGKLCMPAVEEFGMMLKDQVTAWRAARLVKLAEKAQQKMKENGVAETAHADPRIVHEILEKASWIEDAVVQDMWAGLLSSACTESGEDDSNLLFIDQLGRLSKLQVRVLQLICRAVDVTITDTGLVNSSSVLRCDLASLAKKLNEEDLQRLDRDLDDLRVKGLTKGGVDSFTGRKVELLPTALALHLFVRAQGTRISPDEYFSKVMAERSAQLGNDTRQREPSLNGVMITIVTLDDLC